MKSKSNSGYSIRKLDPDSVKKIKDNNNPKKKEFYVAGERGPEIILPKKDKK